MHSFANLLRASIAAGNTVGATLNAFVSTRRKTIPRTVARRRFGAILIEHLESRHLMAAVPVARDDAAFYTNVSLQPNRLTLTAEPAATSTRHLCRL
jgi:hypothetical protein